MKCPEKENIERQKVELWLPRVGGGVGDGQGVTISFQDDAKNVLILHSSDSCTPL